MFMYLHLYLAFYSLIELTHIDRVVQNILASH